MGRLLTDRLIDDLHVIDPNHGDIFEHGEHVRRAPYRRISSAALSGDTVRRARIGKRLVSQCEHMHLDPGLTGRPSRIDRQIRILRRRSFAAADRQRRKTVSQKKLHFDRVGSFLTGAQTEQLGGGHANAFDHIGATKWAAAQNVGEHAPYFFEIVGQWL